MLGAKNEKQRISNLPYILNIRPYTMQLLAYHYFLHLALLHAARQDRPNPEEKKIRHLAV